MIDKFPEFRNLMEKHWKEITKNNPPLSLKLILINLLSINCILIVSQKEPTLFIVNVVNLIVLAVITLLIRLVL